MNNPITVEVTRGQLVESRHRGMAVVVDGDGRMVFSAGDVDAAVFPRSACKAMQALPLIESGAAERFGFGERELALACASHSGEPEHVALAAAPDQAQTMPVEGGYWGEAVESTLSYAISIETGPIPTAP